MGDNSRMTSSQSKIATGTNPACRKVSPLGNMPRTTKNTGTTAADRPRVLVAGGPDGTQNHVLGNNRRKTSNGQTPASRAESREILASQNSSVAATATHMLHDVTERTGAVQILALGMASQCFFGSWFQKIFPVRATREKKPSGRGKHPKMLWESGFSAGI